MSSPFVRGKWTKKGPTRGGVLRAAGQRVEDAGGGATMRRQTAERNGTRARIRGADLLVDGGRCGGSGRRWRRNRRRRHRRRRRTSGHWRRKKQRKHFAGESIKKSKKTKGGYLTANWSGGLRARQTAENGRRFVAGGSGDAGTYWITKKGISMSPKQNILRGQNPPSVRLEMWLTLDFVVHAPGHSDGHEKNTRVQPLVCGQSGTILGLTFEVGGGQRAEREGQEAVLEDDVPQGVADGRLQFGAQRLGVDVAALPDAELEQRHRPCVANVIHQRPSWLSVSTARFVLAPPIFQLEKSLLLLRA